MRTNGHTRARHGKKPSAQGATAAVTALKAPKLAPKVASKIVNTADLDGDPIEEGSGAERRRSKREQVFAMGVPGQIRQLDELNDCEPTGTPIHIMVLDVSLHGVGFRSTKKLDKDGLYLVEIGVGPLHLSS